MKIEEKIIKEKRINGDIIELEKRLIFVKDCTVEGKIIAKGIVAKGNLTAKGILGGSFIKVNGFLKSQGLILYERGRKVAIASSGPIEVKGSIEAVGPIETDEIIVAKSIKFSGTNRYLRAGHI